ELESLPLGATDTAALAAWVDEHRSLVMTVTQADPAQVGVAYSFTLTSWGGTPPLTWILDDGALPAGLTVSPDGVISGTPTESGSCAARFRVTDSGVSPQTGEPATFAQSVTVVVGEAAEARAAWVAGMTADVATFSVPARPGQHVQVCATLDDTHDN